MDNQIVNEILERYSHFRTCSVDNPKEESITFIRHRSRRESLFGAPETLVVIAPHDSRLDQVGPFTVYEADDPEMVFARVHNVLAAVALDPEDVVSPYAEVHPTAVIGLDGLKIVQGKAGGQVALRHTGNVVVKEGAAIGPNSVVHRACLDSTVIGPYAIVGSLCNVGHNVRIGMETILTAGVMVGGSVVIGKNCFISMGSVINNGVRIPDNTMVGANATVVRTIEEPGVYVGSPARFIRPWDGLWGAKEGGKG